MVVGEDDFTKKKQLRQEELKELEDRKHLEEFKRAKRKPVKRARIDEDETLPKGWKATSKHKRLKRMLPDEGLEEMTE